MKNLRLYFILTGILVLIFSCSRPADSDYTTLVLLSTTDIHGHVFPWDYYEDAPDEQHSLLKAATLIDSVRAQQPHTLLIDAGDWLQGNPFAEFYARVDTTTPYPLLQTMEALQYDAVVVGNHEFNFGLPHLYSRLNQTDVDFLAANAIVKETDGHAFLPQVIKTFDGFKVGIIGLTTPGSAVWDRPRVEDRIRFEDGVEHARIQVKMLQEIGMDVIVIAMHSGFEGSTTYTSETLGAENFGKLIADQVPGIHAIVAGHTHRVIEDLVYTSEANPQGVAITQAGRWGSHLGYAELKLSKTEQGTEVRFGENRAISVEHAEPHQELYTLLQPEHERVRAYINEAVATTDSLWDSSDARLHDRAITDLVQRVQLQATGAELSSTAIFNDTARFENGVITRGSLASLYPYENTLYTIRISGKQLREYLEFSARYYEQSTGAGQQPPQPTGSMPGYNFDVVYGASYEINLLEPAGQRIKNLRYQGQEVADSDSFTLALNSYRAVGGGDYDMIANAEVVGVIDVSVRKLIENYLVEKKHINPEEVAQPFWSITY